MMKRVFQWILTIALVMGVMFCMALGASAEEIVASGTCGENVTWSLDDAGVLTISGTGAIYDYGYPDYAPWYFLREQITTAVIEDNVTSIGGCTFLGCSNLTGVTIPDGVTSIGSNAFAGCSSLVSITIPESVTTIDQYAFYNCSNLTDVYISDIAAWCKISFMDTFESNPLWNGADLYLDGELVTDLVIPESITSIGEFAFYGCDSLTSVTIPEGITVIPYAVFANCNNLVSVTIPESVVSIIPFAFENCSSLTSITIPESVTSIGWSAFYGCDSLRHVHYTGTAEQWAKIEADNTGLPSSVVFNAAPGEYTFTKVKSCNFASFYCSGCEQKFLPSTEGALGHRYVGGVCTRCGDDGTWSVSVGYADGIWDITITEYNGNDTDIVIPEYIDDFPVTCIGNCVFLDCGSMESITIPDSITSIGYQAFYNCSSLTSVTIPDSVTTISEWAFCNCSSLESVNIPDSVISIGSVAFLGCSSLESVVIPDSVTNIGFSAFAGCSSLVSVTIPESMATINEWTFGDCSSLTSIVFPASVTYVGDSAFVGCTALTDVYYTGTQAQWESFGLGIDNDPLLLANVHFNYDPSAGACSHSYGDWVITGVPTFTSAGSQEKTCDLCGDVVSETIPAAVGKVEQWNVSLEDDLVVTFHLNISAILENTARVRIYVGDDTYNFRTATMGKTADGLYVASVNIAAAQMSDYIMVSFTNNGAMAQTQSYTVRQYADALLSNAGYSQYHELVREMLNYGAAAQAYFDYSEDALANEGITGAGKVEIPESTDEEMSVTGSAQGIHFYAASLIFRNKISVRYYFNCDGNINGYTFTANGKMCMPQLKNGLFYVEVDGIMPEDLDQPVELIVTDGNGDVLTVCYSPMNYIVRMNEKGSESLKALLKALYNYHLAAKALRAA